MVNTIPVSSVDCVSGAGVVDGPDVDTVDAYSTSVIEEKEIQDK